MSISENTDKMQEIKLDVNRIVSENNSTIEKPFTFFFIILSFLFLIGNKNNSQS